MTFNAAIPNPGDFISASQSQIKDNFSQSNTAFGIDHTAFDIVSDQGKHKKSTYVEQGSNPVTSSNEVALYSKDLSGVSTLYLRKESNGTVVQMSGQDPTIAASGSTFLPGGIVLKWGTQAIVAASTVVSFASAFPTACFGVNVNIVNATYSATLYAYPKTGAFNTTDFTLLGPSLVNYTIFYFAIGN